MNKHILICSAQRSATHWLTQMLRANVDGDGSDTAIMHEGIKRLRLEQLVVRWSKPGIHIDVGVGSTAIDLLYEKFPDLQLALLVREPISQLMSMHNKGGVPRGLTTDLGLFMTGGFNWGMLEVMLATAKALGLDMPAWHFDYYTTLDGVTELVTSLGLKLKPNPILLKPTNIGKGSATVNDFSAEILNLLQVQHSRPILLSEAYAKAKAYADEKLGRAT